MMGYRENRYLLCPVLSWLSDIPAVLDASILFYDLIRISQVKGWSA